VHRARAGIEILVTGEPGYIGSHPCAALAQTRYNFAIIDNLCNSRRELVVVDMLEILCGGTPQFVEGHVATLDFLQRVDDLVTANLSTGHGHSILDVLQAFASTSGKPVPYRVIAGRRGHVAKYWADPSRANRLFIWTASRDQPTMCANAWRWQNAIRSSSSA
jgi:UDP-glucose 4-epimerase